jgi:hypothetical protein
MRDGSGATAIARPSFSPNDAHAFAIEPEFHFRVRQQACALADFRRMGT